MNNDVIITSGANGIGLKCAKSFKAVGYNVFVLDKDKRNVVMEKVSLKIIFIPTQIARFIYMIIKEFSSYTTGSVFVIDGGRSLS